MMKYFAVLLMIILLTYGVGCGAPEQSTAALPYGELSMDEFHSWLEEGKDFKLVDVREEHEYNEGHIPGARLLPLGLLDDNYMVLDPDETIVLVCRSARRSGEAAAFLAEQGYTNVYNLLGGMLEWSGPVEQRREYYG